MEKENVEETSNDPFYTTAINYWEKIPATVDGMLGGFGFISQTDIEGSKKFLQDIFSSKNPPRKTYACDCGAGIGRITLNFLIKIFDKVDMVEQNGAFLEQARKDYSASGEKHKLGTLYPVGLQNFTPENHRYDVIWCQWVMGHLKDEHFVEFLQRCKKGLKNNGMIVVKENVTSSGFVETDEEDSSVTRPLKLLSRIFKKAGLDCVKETKQNDMPKGLYAVWMFALKPIAEKKTDHENT